MKKLFIILSLIYGCTPTNKLSELKFDCNNRNDIERISDSLIIKLGYIPKLLNRNINENQDSIIVQYLPKDLQANGGGAEIRITKRDCKITRILRYQ